MYHPQGLKQRQYICSNSKVRWQEPMTGTDEVYLKAACKQQSATKSPSVLWGLMHRFNKASICNNSEGNIIKLSEHTFFSRMNFHTQRRVLVFLLNYWLKLLLSFQCQHLVLYSKKNKHWLLCSIYLVSQYMKRPGCLEDNSFAALTHCLVFSNSLVFVLCSLFSHGA